MRPNFRQATFQPVGRLRGDKKVPRFIESLPQRAFGSGGGGGGGGLGGGRKEKPTTAYFCSRSLPRRPIHQSASLLHAQRAHTSQPFSCGASANSLPLSLSLSGRRPAGRLAGFEFAPTKQDTTIVTRAALKFTRRPLGGRRWARTHCAHGPLGSQAAGARLISSSQSASGWNQSRDALRPAGRPPPSYAPLISMSNLMRAPNPLWPNSFSLGARLFLKKKTTLLARRSLELGAPSTCSLPACKIITACNGRSPWSQ